MWGGAGIGMKQAQPASLLACVPDRDTPAQCRASSGTRPTHGERSGSSGPRAHGWYPMAPARHTGGYFPNRTFTTAQSRASRLRVEQSRHPKALCSRLLTGNPPAAQGGHSLSCGRKSRTGGATEQPMNRCLRRVGTRHHLSSRCVPRQPRAFPVGKGTTGKASRVGWLRHGDLRVLLL